MKNLILASLLVLTACTTNTKAPANDGVATTGTHMQNDTGHPCSPADARRGTCY